MSTKQRRTTPCTQCRLEHLSCKWDPASTGVKCKRCRIREIDCSGPWRKTVPACASCVRSSVRCERREGQLLCLRCQSRGNVCPLPPRSSNASKCARIHVARDVRSCRTSVVKSPILAGLLSGAMRNAIRSKGALHLQRLQLPYAHSGKRLEMLDDLSDIVATIAGLKFCNSVSLSGKSQVHSIEDMTPTFWLTHRNSTPSVQSHGLQELASELWSLFVQIPSLDLSHYDSVVQLVVCLRTALKFRIWRQDKERCETVRTVLAYVTLLALVTLKSSAPSNEHHTLLIVSAVQLADREARLSATMGVPSRLAQPILCLLPSIAELPPIPDVFKVSALLSLNDADVWRLLNPLTETLFRLSCSLGSQQGNPFTIWRYINRVYSYLDRLNDAVHHTLGDRAGGVARSIFCVQLCAIEADILVVRMCEEKEIATSRSFAASNRAVRGLMPLIVSSHNLYRAVHAHTERQQQGDIRLSELYHVLDCFVIILESIGEDLVVCAGRLDLGARRG
ncbi:hypothetical protein BCR39DRAFT_343940 [Naematelia encephala]|uniref:Zn(2)-C6 fungal-type domain-containing protein n=1 Tax=Naematelia encephala TaxID=71784 RepID=A0A1Y2AM71_9TREE|nr:hypothetical protein BCR39DRAFT_343940 [Naematelia encephala]